MASDDGRQHPADVADVHAGAGLGMTDGDRTVRPNVGNEKALLEAFLDFQRDTLLWKVSGLSEEQLRKVWTPSGMSLLGLVKHLAYVERNWFQNRFVKRDLPVAWSADDPDGDFRIEPHETAESVIAFYRAEVAESKRIVAAADPLDTIAQHPSRPHSLRRIIVHMIEETARHCGHADLMREYTDGQTGE
jgi:uncharacterized damage-inducible protein DinB